MPPLLTPRPRPLATALTLAVVLAAALPAAAWAHVKWFSAFSFADEPLALAEAVTPLVLGLLALSMVVIGSLVWADRWLTRAGWHERLDSLLAAQTDRSLLVLRVGAGATMLLAWQGDAIFVPELEITGAWVGWAQFVIALLLLFRKTTPLAGAGLLALYAYGFGPFRALHMLDYAFVAGVGVYFLVAGSRIEQIRAIGLPALYGTVGFSLCWVALEKLIYPQWALYILGQNPQLTLGFDLDFFLTGAAFVEFSLGYLLIICLLQRPLALVITLVFFSTTLVFGKVEVVGHTLVHAALIVFVIEGPGRGYSAPYTFHRKPALRTAFAAVNVALLFGLLIVPYAHLAQSAYASYAEASAPMRAEIPAGQPAPTVALDVQHEADGSYLVRVQTNGFAFGPPPPQGTIRLDEGHAHLYLDGRKVARLYGPVYSLDPLPPGRHTLRTVLSTHDHRLLTQGGELIAAEQVITVE